MRRFGFTILEVLVALTLGVVVLGTAVSLAAVASEQGAAARRRAHLARTASFLDLTLARDLRHAGLGMPTGPFHSGTFGGGPGRFNAPILIGTATSVGIVGDVPRPDADAAPFGSLATLPGGPGRFFWFNDVTGICIPSLGNIRGCAISDTSRVLTGVGGCNRIGGGIDANCPWGLRRVLPDEYLVVTAGDGSWALARMPALGAALVRAPAPHGDHLLLQSAGLPADWVAARWPNANPSVDPPTALRGQGFVATLDRVFYVHSGTTISRIQCMGTPEPDNTGFPDKDALVVPSVAALSYAPSGGQPRTTCVGPELIADHVESLAFTYVDAAGAALAVPLNAADKRATRGVRWRVAFHDRRGTHPVREVVEGAIALRNLP